MIGSSTLRITALGRASSVVCSATSVARRATFATSSARLAGAPSQSGPGPLHNTVQITRLPTNTKEEELRQTLQSMFHGTITGIELKHMGPKGDIPARCHAHVAYASPEQAQKVVNARRANGNKLPRAWQHRRVFFNVHPTYGSTSRAWAFVKHRGQPGDVSAQQIAEALKMGVDDVELFGTSAVVKLPSAERVKELSNSTTLVAGKMPISVEQSTSWPPPPSRTLRYSNFTGSEADLRQLFEPFRSTVEKISSIPPKSRAGTISFKSTRTATKALNSLNKTPTANGGRLQLQYVPAVEPK